MLKILSLQQGSDSARKTTSLSGLTRICALIFSLERKYFYIFPMLRSLCTRRRRWVWVWVVHVCECSLKYALADERDVYLKNYSTDNYITRYIMCAKYGCCGEQWSTESMLFWASCWWIDQKSFNSQMFWEVQQNVQSISSSHPTSPELGKAPNIFFDAEFAFIIFSFE